MGISTNSLLLRWVNYMNNQTVGQPGYQPTVGEFLPNSWVVSQNISQQLYNYPALYPTLVIIYPEV